jgi:hypothetical protein
VVFYLQIVFAPSRHRNIGWLLLPNNIGKFHD